MFYLAVKFKFHSQDNIMESKMRKNNCRLQFLVDENTFERFEKLRLGRFCGTSRTYLLTNILKVWLRNTEPKEN
jgi:hypothetical protein